MILAYPLEELFAEEMRSILERGKSRDYYEVWRILKEKIALINFKNLKLVFEKKQTQKA